MSQSQSLSATNILSLPTVEAERELEPETEMNLNGMNHQSQSTSGRKRSADKPPTDRKPRPRKDANAELIRDLAGFYASIGLLVTQFDTYSGVILMQKAEDRAKELVGVAQHHKWLMDALKRISKSNDYITLLLGHGIMAYAILAHHGQVPAQPMLLAQFGYGPIEGIAQEPQQEDHFADYATASLNGHL